MAQGEPHSAGIRPLGGCSLLAESNQKNLLTIAERAAAKTSGATPVEKMVGDFFASGMDETAINAAGIPPLQPELDRLKAIKTPAEFLTALARLQPFGVGFRCGSSPDPKPSEPQRAVRGSGSPGLLERGHDFNDDEKSLKIPQVGRL